MKQEGYFIEELQKELEEHDLEYCGQCYDCGTSVSVLISVTEEDAITIEGGAVYTIKQGLLGEHLYFKCDTCYAIDKTLRNFRQCEVYSRVVGYLRPISGWNKGKKAEFELRKEFKNPL